MGRQAALWASGQGPPVWTAAIREASVGEEGRTWRGERRPHTTAWADVKGPLSSQNGLSLAPLTPPPRSVLALLSCGEHTGASQGASGPAHLHTCVFRSPGLLGGFGSEMSGFESSCAACPVQTARPERLSPIYKMGVMPPFRAVWGANGPSWKLLPRSPQALKPELEGLSPEFPASRTPARCVPGLLKPEIKQFPEIQPPDL